MNHSDIIQSQKIDAVGRCGRSDVLRLRYCSGDSTQYRIYLSYEGIWNPYFSSPMANYRIYAGYCCHDSGFPIFK